jgi:hypothetical protein
MLKKYFSTLCFLCLAVFASAQDVSPALKDSSVDTLSVRYKKIILVPYNPIMQLSDANHDIAEYSEKTVDMVRAIFRRGILQNLSEALNDYVCNTFPMGGDMSKETAKELDMIYGSLNYVMDTVYPVAHPQRDSTKSKTAGQAVKSLFTKSKGPKVKEVHDLKYMNIILTHPELLAKLAEKYNTDLFIFLNQFEIKTHYDDCLDLPLKIYRRELKVHYSIFDVTGKQLYGDVAVVNFPSNSNDISDIMVRNFPKISDYIVKTVRPILKSKIKQN